MIVKVSIYFISNYKLLFVELCPPNTYSANGFVPCMSCPSLQYQLYHGQRWCTSCNNNETSIDSCEASKGQ